MRKAVERGDYFATREIPAGKREEIIMPFCRYAGAHPPNNDEIHKAYRTFDCIGIDENGKLRGVKNDFDAWGITMNKLSLADLGLED
ncbi:MAG: hypothetical protein GYB19_10375 [Rhodospirillales bacterium]|nr:hypothetical protein [Rhodospirillales bacterium]